MLLSVLNEKCESSLLNVQNVSACKWRSKKQCDHSNEKSPAVLFCGTVCFSVNFTKKLGIFLGFYHSA